MMYRYYDNISQDIVATDGDSTGWDIDTGCSVEIPDKPGVPCHVVSIIRTLKSPSVASLRIDNEESFIETSGTNYLDYLVSLSNHLRYSEVKIDFQGMKGSQYIFVVPFSVDPLKLSNDLIRL